MICTHVPYLKAWRKSRGYSCQVLAYRAKISRQTLWALEAGVKAARTETILRLAEALDIGLHDLVHVHPGEEVPFTIIYDAVDLAFRCVCGTPLHITKRSLGSLASGVFCQVCGEQWWVNWSEVIVHRGQFDSSGE